ncbi:MAG: hypothetical protein KKE00_09650 [Proteobacteria bacterium]|nr:hypothetical protein [Pseudomonadota bacterium]MBU1398933.1 hypothetical protein [Pseudomonadota bacterium]MBU1570764.1 hypothetical protein [Pseudomonadota bacterium]
MVKTKNRKKSDRGYESFPVRIIDWKTDYSLSLGKNHRFSEGPYWEHYCLELKGELLGPDRIKGREIKVMFLANRKLDQAIAHPDSIKWEPKALGGLTSRGKNSDFIGSLPFQLFGQILTMLQCDKTKYIVFGGEAMYHGQASIKDVTLTGEFNPEDY